MELIVALEDNKLSELPELSIFLAKPTGEGSSMGPHIFNNFCTVLCMIKPQYREDNIQKNKSEKRKLPKAVKAVN